VLVEMNNFDMKQSKPFAKMCDKKKNFNTKVGDMALQGSPQ